MNPFIFITIAIVCAILLMKWKLPVWIGRSGEKFVSEELHQLDPAHYKVLNDLLLPSRGNLNTTQIDHIVVSNYGIFCIETKAYSKWIFGDANQEYWTQVIFHHKERFYNPLRQNYAHVKAIEDLIGPQNLKTNVVSLVAFTNAEKLKISGTDSVGYTRDVVRKIKSFAKAIFSDTERDRIYELLVRANILDKEMRKRHNRGVRELKKF